MKIFSWMRSRFNGNESNSKPNPEPISHHVMHQDCKEEFYDWPNALLAIGTFGNNNLKDQEKSNIQVSLTSKQENTVPDQEFEEVDKQLRQLLKKHISLDSGETEKLNYLSIQKLLLDCLPEIVENKDSRLQRSNSVVHRGGKDVRSDNKSSGIGKKSLRFLLKKVFLCRGGFAPNPMLRDPLPDHKLDSRMEKLLRSMLHKKIYPQRSTPKGNTPKKYLDMPEMVSDDEEFEEASHNTSKWVKTDSEYIVLEI